MPPMSTMSPAPAGRPFRGLQPEERQQRRREQLIEAGLEVFGARGFHGVRVRDICVQARLTERYFYESFENREALFLAVYDHAVGRIRDAILAAIPAPAPDVVLTARGALRAFLETLQAEPRLARILLIDVFTVGQDVANQSRRAMQSFADLVRDLVHHLYPEIDALDLDAQLIANGLVGSTVYQAIQWAFNGFKQPLDTVLDHCALFYEALVERAATLQAGLAERSSG
jgi:AcrR family transcriptional regulator